VDTARIAGVVLGTALAEGVVRRRPVVTGFAARHDLDGRAARVLRRVRDRYGPAPLRLGVPGRPMFLVLDPQDVDDVLARTPDPFTPATAEKKAALRHFQPHGVLISSGADRDRRRALNEVALDADVRNHRFAAAFLSVIDRETAPLVACLNSGRTMNWTLFSVVWWRIVRQIVLGAAARHDTRLTADLGSLRFDANWAFLRPRRKQRLRRLESAIQRYAAQPDPESLLGQAPEELADQVPHWLFAFDAAGASVFRALALLSTHRAAAQQIEDVDYARACLLETIRLYPTTLVLLRDAVRPTTLGKTAIPAGASLIVHSGFVNRDRLHWPYAYEFRPETWLDGTADWQAGIVPFSAGPARCPARDLVELTAGATITALARSPMALRSGNGTPPLPTEPLPAGLDHFSLRFRRRK
jgi:cytochrome P450